MVREFLASGKKLLYRRETSILSAASLIMLTVAASRVLGLIRDRLLATHFGAGMELGVFWAADEIPDTIFYILGSAVFSASFVPVFAQYMNRDADHEDGWRLAGSTLNIALLFFLGLSTAIFFLARPICHLVAPGFDAPRLELMAGLVRVMLLGQFFFVFSYFLTGVLNSFQRFLMPALASVFYNLGVVLGTVFLVPRYGIWGAAWGMVLGASLHFAIQLPLAFSLGFSPKHLLHHLHPGVKRVARLTIPRAMALLGSKASLLFQVTLTSLIPAIGNVSNVAVLTFARHLQLLPVGLFGLSISQAALPTLSVSWGAGRKEEFKKTLSAAVHQALFLVLPAAVMLLILRIPLVRLAFGARRFTWTATILTGYTVAFFALGIVWETLIEVLNRAFYALEEAATPVKISLIFTAAKIGLAFMFTRVLGFGVWSIPLALAIGGFFQAVGLFYLLDGRLGGFSRADLLAPLSKIGWASVLAGVALYLPLKLLDQLVFDTTRTVGLIFLTGIAGAFGLAAYFVFTWVMGVRETRVLLVLLLAKTRGFLKLG